jgi:hypothetical protein
MLILLHSPTTTHHSLRSSPPLPSLLYPSLPLLFSLPPVLVVVSKFELVKERGKKANEISETDPASSPTDRGIEDASSIKEEAGTHHHQDPPHTDVINSGILECTFVITPCVALPTHITPPPTAL